MRIGISTSVIQRGKSGIGQYLLALLRAFSRCSQQHDFVLFVLDEDAPLFAFAAERMKIVRVPERFRPPLKNILWHQISLPRWVRKLGIDILHVPSYRRLLWPRPCGLVGTVHDLAPFRVDGKYDPLRMFYGRSVAGRLANRQDALIAVSQNTARDMAACWRIPLERVKVIHNGIDHERFSPAEIGKARRDVAQRYHLSEPFFLYVARLEHPGKNHLRLIEAFGRFKTRTASRWQLALAGGDWHGADVIHRAIECSPCAKDIRVLGFVSDADLPALYQAAGVFVYPSLYEGFGMPPLEAMACGCPVICSDRGSLKEVVGDAGVLLDPLDDERWADQLQRLAQDPSTREQLRVGGLARAQCFNWERTASDTMAVYERAARVNSAGGVT